MNKSQDRECYFLICSIEEQYYAFDIAQVDRSIMAVATSPLPNSPPYILGAIDIHGEIIPAVNTRKLLGLPLGHVKPSDSFVICQIHGKPVAFWVDRVHMVKQYTSDDFLSSSEEITNLKCVQSILRDNQYLILVINLCNLLQPNSVGVYA